jgi:hypothetical protein
MGINFRAAERRLGGKLAMKTHLEPLRVLEIPHGGHTR